jgi:hypothetical protein
MASKSVAARMVKPARAESTRRAINHSDRPTQEPEAGTDFRFDNRIFTLIRSTQSGKTSGTQKRI